MAMVKRISPYGWDFDCRPASLVKVASGGLRGNDRREFVKRADAAANVFLPYLDSVKFAADEVPMHLIALGANEMYGANRNGDGFKEAALKKYHDTFVKFARFYRNHKNKDPKVSYGVVKLSAYNPVMRRVELLVALNKAASAAERNGGFVADREIHKLASGQDIPVSMACRVPYDECSYCGNRARTREEYCKAAGCAAGGCTDNITRVVKVGADVHHLFVHNDHPSFFDISNVFRGADQTASGSLADYVKSAGDGGRWACGVKAAEDFGIVAPLSVVLAQDVMLPGEWSSVLAAQVKLAHGLAAMEGDPKFRLHPETRRAFSPDMRPDVDFGPLGMTDAVKTASALVALADKKIVLTLGEFARLTKRSSLAGDAARALPGVYTRMLADGSLDRRLSGNAHAPAGRPTSAQKAAAAGLAGTHSLDKAAVDRRCKLSAIRGHAVPAICANDGEKRAAAGVPAEELCRDYACYKVAALRHISESDSEFLLTARIAATQNEV